MKDKTNFDTGWIFLNWDPETTERAKRRKDVNENFLSKNKYSSLLMNLEVTSSEDNNLKKIALTNV